MLPCNRLSRLEAKINPSVCPNCLSRGYTTRQRRHARSLKPLYVSGWPIITRPRPNYHPHAGHPASPSQIRLSTSEASTTNTSSLDNSTSSQPGVLFEKSEDVRNYLKSWSRDYQKSVRDNAPELVQLQRNSTLPNSLFVRSNVDESERARDEVGVSSENSDAEVQPDFAEDVDDFFTLGRRQLEPGDALRLNTLKGRVRSQLAIYLGTRGVQSLYLLADGRWYADTQNIFMGGTIPGFISDKEISHLDPFLPLKTVEYRKAEDGGTVPFTTFGEIPPAAALPYLRKLTALSEELEEAKRRYSTVLDQMHEKAAHQTAWRFVTLESLLRDHTQIELDDLSSGAKLYLVDALFADERMCPLLMKSSYCVSLMPKRSQASLATVTDWARSYQDAAARAATGQNVIEELRKNPLTNFISKARRIISQSRKIRLPTSERQLGPTLEDVRPPSGKMERKSSGEEFTQDEKMIIDFLWLVFVRKPSVQNVGLKRSKAVASLIIRAVGAYPKFVLDSDTGTLFLKELGCLDPWTTSSDSFVHVPNPTLGLNHEVMEAREKANDAAAALGIKEGQEEVPLLDTMAHLRKDWGDLEVFCIDKKVTQLIDDGISIEPSQDLADHYWIRVHIAHLSALVPHDSPLLAQGPVMGGSSYHTYGVEPYIPYAATDAANLRSKAPVMTISTLLSPDGSVKDIDIQAGTINNVIKIDATLFHDKIGTKKGIGNVLSIGTGKTHPRIDLPHEYLQKHNKLIEHYEPTFQLLQKLLNARWEARYRENPEYLKMLKLPLTSQAIKLSRESIEKSRGDIHDRIYRSEHVFGDPTITVNCEVQDHDRVSYENQSMRKNVIAAAMMLCAESAAVWTSRHNVPVIYRYTGYSPGFPLSKLNSLGPHDHYVAPGGGESVDIAPHLTLNMPGYLHVTSPLRRYRDLINHHQIDAYLKGKAERKDSTLTPDLASLIQYPHSRNDLLDMTRAEGDGGLLNVSDRNQKMHWVLYVLYRAFYFHEAKLPEVWDVFVDNPVSLGSDMVDSAKDFRGTLVALGVKVVVQESAQGWEKLAKFRQFLPSKIIRIEPNHGSVYCEAVGPPSDNPHVEGLAYSELQRNEMVDPQD